MVRKSLGKRIGHPPKTFGFENWTLHSQGGDAQRRLAAAVCSSAQRWLQRSEQRQAGVTRSVGLVGGVVTTTGVDGARLYQKHTLRTIP